MQVVEQAATIESLQARLSELQIQQNDAQQGLESAKAGIANLSESRKSLLIKGDATSGASVVKIEATLVDLERSKEAYQFRLDALTSQITEVQGPLLVLQQKAMENQRIQKTEELSQEAARLAHNKHALWRAASRAAFAEAEFHAKAVPTAGVSQSQQAQIRQVAIDAHDHRGDAFNEKWARGFVFVANLTVEPLCPPDDLRHLEVLK
jgi:prefoldin subunit 5